MQTFHELSEVETDHLCGGGDSFARDAGQLLGGGTGWIRANLGTYLLLGPGIGGLVAAYHGFQEAAR